MPLLASPTIVKNPWILEIRSTLPIPNMRNFISVRRTRTACNSCLPSRDGQPHVLLRAVLYDPLQSPVSVPTPLLSSNSKAGALGSEPSFSSSPSWIRVGHGGTSLRWGRPPVRHNYAQHSRRYSGLAPCAHMDAWTLEGCFSDRTSEVLRHSVLTNEIFSQLWQTIESNTSYVPNPTAHCDRRSAVTTRPTHSGRQGKS